VTAALILFAIIALLFSALILVGRRSRVLFSDPSALSDSQIERMIALTQSIMAKSQPGSDTWVKAAQSNKAALDERLRRRGEEDFSDVEILAPDPEAR